MRLTLSDNCDCIVSIDTVVSIACITLYLFSVFIFFYVKVAEKKLRKLDEELYDLLIEMRNYRLETKNDNTKNIN